MTFMEGTIKVQRIRKLAELLHAKWSVSELNLKRHSDMLISLLAVWKCEVQTAMLYF